MSPADDLVAGVRAGERRAMGRAMTAIESGGEIGRAVMAGIHPHTGGATRLGVTGPPGVGKSTLIGALVAHRRSAAASVGVVSVDPTSPFTNGAVLGDRIRLTDHFTDPGVFIRSMASRGQLGGVAEGTAGAMAVLEAAGLDLVIVETVGAGQNEVDVASLVDTVCLVLMPGSGDGVQAIKAGVMEIPDIVVVNKADHPAAALLRAELEAAMRLVPHEGWQVPIVETQANAGVGIDELWTAVERHREFMGPTGLQERRRQGMARQLRSRALASLARALDRAVSMDAIAAAADAVVRRDIDPLSATGDLVARLALPAGRPTGS